MLRHRSATRVIDTMTLRSMCVWLGAAAAIAACSASEGAIGSAGVSDAGASVDASLGDDTLGDAALRDDAFVACATDTVRAAAIPLDLFVMLDSSGSMNEKTASGASKWSAVTSALSSFFADPASSGVFASLAFFPAANAGVPLSCTSTAQCNGYGPCMRRACLQQGPTVYCDFDFDCASNRCVDIGECADGSNVCIPGVPGAGCTSGAACLALPSAECSRVDACAVGRYSSPQVPLAALPAAAPALASAMSQRTLRGFTPTGPALAGAIEGAKALAAAAPTHTVAALFVTDGLPTSCTPLAPASIATSATTGLAAGIRTYVVGVFSPADETEARANLDVIAKAGGSTSAIMVTTNRNVAADLLAALADVRRVAMPCEYAVPAPARGTPDFAKVNVQITQNGAPRAVPMAASTAACGGGEAWTYDRSPSQGAPSKIVLCPAACGAVRKDASARVDVVLGCATVVK